MLLKKLVAKATAAMAALYIAYRVYIWRRYDRLTLQTGFPIVPLADTRWWMRPFGNFFRQIAHWHRIYDLKVDNFNNLGSPLTVALHAPIWSKYPDSTVAEQGMMN